MLAEGSERTIQNVIKMVEKNVFKTEWTPIAMHQTDGTINK